jgi:hypothetical protein
MRVREGWSINYQIIEMAKSQTIVSVLEVGQNKEMHKIHIAEIRLS